MTVMCPVAMTAIMMTALVIVFVSVMIGAQLQKMPILKDRKPRRTPYPYKYVQHFIVNRYRYFHRKLLC
jgi:hypothetical protein